MSGILFPLFMLLAFAVGKAAPLLTLIPGLIAITALFSASSIEPVSVPIERQTKTFDRLLSAPISMFSLVLGESISGFMFAGSICLLLFIAGLFLYHPPLTLIFVLIVGIALSCFTFANFGTVFAAYPTENVGEVMSLLNLIRLPPYLHQRCVHSARIDAILGADHCNVLSPNLWKRYNPIRI